MSATATATTWTEANQRYLTAALARLAAALAAREVPAEAWDDALPPPALTELARTFGLSPFERDVVLLCAGVELDAGFAEAVRERGGATFGLALAALPGAHWSALAPAAPLRHWRLVDPRPGDTLAGSPLRIDERVLHFLTGVPGLDENLVGFVRPVAADADLVPSHRALAERVAAVWARSEGGRLPAIQLCGGEAAGQRAVAAAACGMLGLGLHRMPAAVLPAGPHEFDALLRLWAREAVLSGSALLLDVGEGEGDAGLVRRFVDECEGPLIMAARERLPADRPVVAFDVARPAREEQRALWAEVLGPRAATLNGHVDRVTAQFDLSAPAIRAAGARTLAETDDGAALWEACRAQARQALGGLARRIEPAASWDDLVLPEPQLRVLREVELHVRHRLRVHEAWGFGRRSSRGLGITALFAGPSGTGKTLAAEVLAHALRLDLYHIDLSGVVSKYIGETEKNLRRVFDAAEAGGAVLLFDEADALFGKRSEVKDSHDRYANLEVSYLLQRMEAYRGLAILTTNLKSALDDAFQRRLRFAVAFPFPDAAQRAAIWRRAFPPETPTEGLDADRLAQLDAAGGTIRTVALHAAFLAAEDDGPVRMAHVRAAARSVYAQLEKPLTDRELRGWT